MLASQSDDNTGIFSDTGVPCHTEAVKEESEPTFFFGGYDERSSENITTEEDWWWEWTNRQDCYTSDLPSLALPAKTEKDLSSLPPHIPIVVDHKSGAKTSEEYMRSVSLLLEEMTDNIPFAIGEEETVRGSSHSSVAWLMQRIRLYMYNVMRRKYSFSTQDRLRVSSRQMNGMGADAEGTLSPLVLLSSLSREITSIRQGITSPLCSDSDFREKEPKHENGKKDLISVGIETEEKVSYALQTFFHSCLGPLIWFWLLAAAEEESSSEGEAATMTSTSSSSTSLSVFSSHSPAKVLARGFQRVLSAEVLRSACLFPVSVWGGHGGLGWRRFLCFLRHTHIQGCLTHCNLEWNNHETSKLQKKVATEPKIFGLNSPFTLVSSFSSLCAGVSDLVIAYMIVLFRSIAEEFSTETHVTPMEPTPFHDGLYSPGEHQSCSVSKQGLSSAVCGSFACIMHAEYRRRIAQHVIRPLVNELWLVVLYLTTYFGSIPMRYQREYDRLGHQDAIQKSVSDAIRSIIAEIESRDLDKKMEFGGNNTHSNNSGSLNREQCGSAAEQGSKDLNIHTSWYSSSESGSCLPMLLKRAFPQSCSMLELHHREVLRLHEKIAQSEASSLPMGQAKCKPNDVGDLRGESAVVPSFIPELLEEEVFRETVSSSLVSSAVLDIRMPESVWWFLKALVGHLKAEWARNENGLIPALATSNDSACIGIRNHSTPGDIRYSCFSSGVCESANHNNNNNNNSINFNNNKNNNLKVGKEEIKDQPGREKEGPGKCFLKLVSRRHLLFEGVTFFLQEIEERLNHYQRHQQYLLPLTLGWIEMQNQSRLDNLHFSKEPISMTTSPRGNGPKNGLGFEKKSSLSAHHVSPLPPRSREENHIPSCAEELEYSFPRDPQISPLTIASNRIRGVFHCLYHSSFISQHIVWEDVLRVHNTRLNRSFFWNCVGVRQLYRTFLTSLPSFHGHLLSSFSDECRATCFGKGEHERKRKSTTASEYILSEVDRFLSEGCSEVVTHDKGNKKGLWRSGSSRAREVIESVESERGKSAFSISTFEGWREEVTVLEAYLSRMWAVLEDCHKYLTVLQTTTEGICSGDGSSTSWFPSSKRRLGRSTRSVGSGFMVCPPLSASPPRDFSTKIANGGSLPNFLEGRVENQRGTIGMRCCSTSCLPLSPSLSHRVFSHPPQSREAFSEGLDHSLSMCSQYVGGMESLSESWCGTVLGAAGETPHDHHSPSFIRVSPAVRVFLQEVKAHPDIFDTISPPYRSPQTQYEELPVQRQPPSGLCNSSLIGPGERKMGVDGVGWPTRILYHPHKHFLSGVFYLFYHPSCFVALQEHFRRPHQQQLKQVLSSLNALLYPSPTPKTEEGHSGSSFLQPSSLQRSPTAAASAVQEEDARDIWWKLQLSWRECFGIGCASRDWRLHQHPRNSEGRPHSHVDTSETQGNDEASELFTAMRKCNEDRGTSLMMSRGKIPSPPPLPMLEQSMKNGALEDLGNSTVKDEELEDAEMMIVSEVSSKNAQNIKKQEEGEEVEKEEEEDWWDFHGEDMEEEEGAGMEWGGETRFSPPSFAVPSEGDEENTKKEKEAAVKDCRDGEAVIRGELTCSGVAAALLGQDPDVMFFLFHTVLSLLPPVKKSGSESWMSLVERSREVQASSAVKNQVELSNTLLLPLLMRITTPLPQLLHYYVASSLSPSLRGDSAAFQNQGKKVLDHDNSLDSFLSFHSHIPPFSSAFLLLCLRASGMLQLPWSVGETLLVLHRFQRLCDYLLSSQRQRQERCREDSRRWAVHRAGGGGGPVSFCPTPASIVHFDVANNADLFDLPSRKRSREGDGSMKCDFSEFMEEKVKRRRKDSLLDIDDRNGRAPCSTNLSSSCDGSFPFSVQWCLSTQSQVLILQKLGWVFSVDGARAETGRQTSRDTVGIMKEAMGLGNSSACDTGKGVEEMLPMREIDKWNARENPLLWAALHACAGKQSGNLLVEMEEEEEEAEEKEEQEEEEMIMKGGDSDAAKEEEENGRRTIFSTFFETRVQGRCWANGVQDHDGTTSNRRKKSFIPLAERRMLRARYRQYYRQLVTSINGGANPSTHWLFESALLIPHAVSTTHIPPSPCGVLLVMSAYRTISSIFLQQRKEWSDACHTIEEEEEQWGIRDVGTGAHCASLGNGPMRGWGSSSTLGRSGEGGGDHSRLPPLCSAEDVTVLLVHIRVVHRMLFTHNIQSFLPTLFSKWGLGGTERGKYGGRTSRGGGGGPSSLFEKIIFEMAQGGKDGHCLVSRCGSKYQEKIQNKLFLSPTCTNKHYCDSVATEGNDNDHYNHPHHKDDNARDHSSCTVPSRKIAADDCTSVLHNSLSPVSNEFTASALRLLIMLGKNGGEARGSDLPATCGHPQENRECLSSHSCFFPTDEGRPESLHFSGKKNGDRDGIGEGNACQDHSVSSFSSSPPAFSSGPSYVNHEDDKNGGGMAHQYGSNIHFSLFQLWLGYLEHFCRVILPPAGEEDIQMLSLLPSSQRISKVWTPLSCRFFSSLDSVPPSLPGDSTTSQRRMMRGKEEGAGGSDGADANHHPKDGKENTLFRALSVDCEGWRALTWPMSGAAYAPPFTTTTTTTTLSSSLSFSSCSSLLSMPTQIRILLGEALADLVVAVLEEVASLMMHPTHRDADEDNGESAGGRKGDERKIFFPPPPSFSPPFIGHFLPAYPSPADMGFFRQEYSRPLFPVDHFSSTTLSSTLRFSESRIRLFRPSSSSTSGMKEGSYFIEDVEIEHPSLGNVRHLENVIGRNENKWMSNGENTRNNEQQHDGGEELDASLSSPFSPQGMFMNNTPHKKDEDLMSANGEEVEELQFACLSIPRMILKELCTSLLLPLPPPPSGFGDSRLPYAVYTHPASIRATNQKEERQKSDFLSMTGRGQRNASEMGRSNSCACEGTNARKSIFESYEEAAQACWLGVHGLVSFLRRLESRVAPGTIQDPSIGVPLSYLWELADILTLERKIA